AGADQVLPARGAPGGGAGAGHGAVGSVAGAGPRRPARGRPDRGAGVGARLSDSRLYAHLWGTDELRAVFDEAPRLQGWLDVLAALARAQADLGIIPEEAARAIARSSS